MTEWQLDVRADLEWQKTDIYQLGDSETGLSVRAAGTWIHSSDWEAVGPDGRIPGKEGLYHRHLETEGKTEFLHSGPRGYMGSLIGKWGPDGTPFKVGDAYLYISDSPDPDKKLYLAMNDKSGAGFEDNSGVMHILARTYDRRAVAAHWSYNRFSQTWSTSTY
ncbi:MULTISPECIES: hypothetical protein [Streptomyces]|uniref:hypothetical protein n=1 Tax=Streptomyces TaxID=1883 RepID=UPI00224990A5|nr:hypothetical protein [Streptomyces sp. JHD 1]MCX2969238.1 hypothetical protein [Streptomyces sp. JHD 1]